MNVLVIDDDAALTEDLTAYLRRHRFTPCVAHDCKTASQSILHQPVDVILLDVMLPDMSGFDFLPVLRRMTDVPVIMLTALGEEEDRVTGLNLGADDYLTKPFSAKELVARLRAIRRRQLQDSASARLVVNDLSLLPGQLTVYVGEQEVSLTGVECGILKLLMNSPNEVVTRQVFYRQVLGREESPFDRSLDTHVSNLRRKLGAHLQHGTRIRALRSVGYILAA